MKSCYGITGPCTRCLRSPATSACAAKGQPEQRLCRPCADAFWERVNAWLLARGIVPA